MNILSITNTYDEILQGKRRNFLRGTWSYGDNAERVMRYLIENKLQWSREDVCARLDKAVLAEYKLATMLLTCFGGSPYEALEATYPGEYKPWELKCTPMNFWSHDTGVEATKWLIEEKLKWNDDNVRSMLTTRTFRETGFEGMLKTVFSYSPYKALNAAYPGKFKPWELKKTTKNCWDENIAIEATKWLIDERLQWAAHNVRKNLSKKIFASHGLAKMLKICFDNDPYKALEKTYPGEYTCSEFLKISKRHM